MILGIGIDIIRIGRMTGWPDDPGLLDRFFHPDEIAAARSRGDGMLLSLAARFAAKEAFGKALGTGLAGIRLRDIRVRSAANGRPELLVEGSAGAALEAIGGKQVFVSLTHESDNAVAVVVIEGE